MSKQNKSDGVPEVVKRDVATLDRPFFAAHIGSTLKVPFENIADVELRLTEVSELKESKRQERFAVLFRGPLEVPLAQGNYVVELEGTGVFDLFLVPVAMDEQGYSYEAVFNRLLSETN
ncbi:MAG: hypothetical protein QOE77_598 [Blastocatellia bacterium]|jgi:hypothetical protein|nr:hypothetical protein [Blastocatellia bacterium]